MSEWTTPKTNWEPSDKFNFTDYNRIRNNLIYLKERANRLIRPFEIEDMGEDITSYLAYWDVQFFNAIEKNIDIISENAYGLNYGIRQTFYDNGAFIKWDELNRIESATVDINNMIDRQEVIERRLSFVLGGFAL